MPCDVMIITAVCPYAVLVQRVCVGAIKLVSGQSLVSGQVYRFEHNLEESVFTPHF